ncbi:glycoside hydrolase family 92 protein [Paramuribaculum intestinale]|uniref:Glycoside hydrolase family 92 protein n=16 Tax=Paramuribaculum intestinale TaxID=2094151 RepID=A0A2V1IXM9_9BACT|nr:GH92 family glycosyl hydrolase [Paramuribaculum intestinale]PWB07381.1 glycoside hydrolase family 92 protein [Paramuribaculum intestinale]PWB10635.1 glycoside hydrolase family 92 protein [Paramuribaculum intestinale]
MNKLLTAAAAAGVIIAAAACSTGNETATETDYAAYVNPFIGAADNGHTFPGATTPFGMIQTSPVTGAVGWRYCSEYVYSDSVIWGFTQTHLNGTGCMDLGDILVMPSDGSRRRDWDQYRSPFDKSTESASPGYYAVTLSAPDVRAELTATPHAALHRYTYNRADSSALLIDLQHGPAWSEAQYHSHVRLCETQWEDSVTLTGHVINSVWASQDYFFVMQFDHPVSDITTLAPATDTERGQRIVAGFDLRPGEQLMMKVALSTTSVDGARRNLQAELPGWDFDAVSDKARADWNSYLGRIDVDGTDTQKTNFYTAFYHSLLQPNMIADVDGSYRNAADSVVKATGGEFYSTFSLWDTYRAAHPFYTLMVPERVDGFVNSLVEQAETQGFLPIWGLWGKETYTMVANHGVPVIAEAYRKGFRGFDADRAFEAIKRTQTVSHPQKSDWEIYTRYGYFPTDSIRAESVSSTLETAYDDYAAADMASLLGRTDDEKIFRERADYYKNLFDSQTGFMRPRLTDGTWRTPFDPASVGHSESVGGDYTEGNAWQYTWHVQHDVPGLIALMGGNDAFADKLDSMFTTELVTTQADVTGLIGQYAHGNEPSHHVTYLYALAGRPWRTQELIRQIVDTQYRPEPDGLSGNDDCGQMSAWYMFSCMGFYPVDPVSATYVIGAPQMPGFTLHLTGGKTFSIRAEGLSKENLYVESVTLNGKPHTSPYITHDEITRGGELVFKMTDRHQSHKSNNR